MPASPAPAVAVPDPVRLADALPYWLKLGFISFGGPAGQIAMMHQELVERRRWISERRFLHALNYCMLLPGPEAIQLAIYLAWLMHGVAGGILAGILFFLPAFALLVALSWVYLAFGALPAVAGILWGIKPAVVAIVVFAAWRIGSKALKNNLLWGFAAAAFLAIFAFDLPFPAIVLAAAAAGALGGKLAPDKFRAGGGHGAAAKAYGPALIDDDTPPPPHAAFRWGRLALYAAGGLVLWGAAMLAVSGTLRDMGGFFTKAALLTFGGAYAVLPYVYQGAVEHYGWLTGPQMIDGLALGETTPGPLIMVVTYVGFVGAWTKQVLGPDALFMAGLAGAAVATFFTFLPSFLFILAGGPLVEATHGDLKFTAPLTGITAAVVGVILNLAVFFAWHVLWPRATTAAPFAGGFEWASLAVAVAAFLALWRWKVDVIPVIAACAALGLLRGLVA
ncbi:MAG: chromate efflux transporter [Rhodocyclaceae bacterium]|nr:chromate efflux transporter [Rhodocyclaceae bacterium]